MNNPMHPADATVTHVTSSHGTNIEGQQLICADPDPESQPRQESRDTSRLNFANLPFELREKIWIFALPDARIFNVLYYGTTVMKRTPSNRHELKMPLTHVCFESRRVVKEAGCILAFENKHQSADPGVWFHPQRDTIDRPIWGLGDGEQWGFK
ncbi:hypothetical protein F4810DRAFT_673450 [Camillea tinctor]|nr:hypothetical protein F4810DRAFT_673450 [Camillea tinctor]